MERLESVGGYRRGFKGREGWREGGRRWVVNAK